MEEPLYLGILNGGGSTRMGEPKSLIPFRGGTLLEHIYGEALKVTPHTVILGEGPLPESLRGIRVLPDYGCHGPIGGVRAAIGYREADWFFWAVDMPLLRAEHVKELLEHRNSSPFALVPYHRESGIYEPYFAYYSRAFLLKINKKLIKTIYSMKKLLKYYNIVGCSDFALRYREELKSWNFPEDVRL